jgi:hypothetical protein
MPPVLTRGIPAAGSFSPGLLRAAPLALLLAAACGKDITVHLRTGDQPPEGGNAAPVASFTRSTVVSGISVDRFQILLRNLRLQENPTTDGTPAPGDQTVSPPMVLVDLSGDGLAPGAMTEIVPPRSLRWASFYQTVVELQPVTAAEVAADAGLAPLQGRTLVIAGRMPGGAPFTFTSSVATVLVLPSVFRAGLNHNNLTVNVALNRWFQGAAGEPLDPTDPAAQATIEANILQSITAYMDDNADGIPDPLG